MFERQVNELRVRCVAVNSVNMVIADGECDICSAQLLKDTMAGIINEGQKKLIVDVKNLRYIDNSGFAAILWARHKIEENGGKIVVVGLNGDYKRKINPLGNILNIASSIGEALWALGERCFP